MKCMNDNIKKVNERLLEALNKNFTSEDLLVTVTYDGDHTPRTKEMRKSLVRNFLYRLERYRGEEGLGELKYITITESRANRIYHNIVMSGGLDRGAIERCWTCGMINVQKIPTLKEEVGLLSKYLIYNSDGTEITFARNVSL